MGIGSETRNDTTWYAVHKRYNCGIHRHTDILSELGFYHVKDSYISDACGGGDRLDMAALGVRSTRRLRGDQAWHVDGADGSAAQLGLDMRLGVEAALHEANLDGGIHGRELSLIVLDDGYEPSRTAPNMHELIEVHEVLAVIGNVGTPTAVAAIPIANAKKTALFGAFTGAGVLRKSPPDRYIINYRASYAQETAAMVDALVDEAGVKVEEIALFTQRDAYGDAGHIGGITAMKRHGLTDDTAIAQGRYQRNTTAVENGLADILSSETPVRAVIMVGSYGPCAEFIKLAHEFDFNPIFMNVSFVGSGPLCGALGADGEG